MKSNGLDSRWPAVFGLVLAFLAAPAQGENTQAPAPGAAQPASAQAAQPAAAQPASARPASARPASAPTDVARPTDAVLDPLLVTEPLLVDPARSEPGSAAADAPAPAAAEPGTLAAMAASASGAQASPSTIVWGMSPEAAHAAPAGAPAEIGEASWYGLDFHGLRTASGEIFDMHAPTVAHPRWPLGSVVRVDNLQNGRSVLARITDRGPFAYGRILDCSYAVAQRLGFVHSGAARVQVTLVDGDRAAWKRFTELAPAPPRKRFGPPAPLEVAVALASVEDTAPPVPAFVTGARRTHADAPDLHTASIVPIPAIVHAWQGMIRWLTGTDARRDRRSHVEQRLHGFGLRQAWRWLAGV